MFGLLMFSMFGICELFSHLDECNTYQQGLSNSDMTVLIPIMYHIFFPIISDHLCCLSGLCTALVLSVPWLKLLYCFCVLLGRCVARDRFVSAVQHHFVAVPCAMSSAPAPDDPFAALDSSASGAGVDLNVWLRDPNENADPSGSAGGEASAEASAEDVGSGGAGGVALAGPFVLALGDASQYPIAATGHVPNSSWSVPPNTILKLPKNSCAKQRFRETFRRPGGCLKNRSFLQGTAEVLVSALPVDKASFLLQQLLEMDELRIGTTCSGGDSCMDAARAILENIGSWMPHGQFRRRAHPSKIRQSWGCEIDDAKRAYLASLPSEHRADQLFEERACNV